MVILLEQCVRVLLPKTAETIAMPITSRFSALETKRFRLIRGDYMAQNGGFPL